ncbi:hypothetical protein AG0111_0g2833 [Alternaria gaisen]|uniref:Uncharacterized protein n=1 Tax=Alternaria gaisen TaxID=167740 RepID=A0ACB6FXD9_9PLEO|nr:hypothetical protein AG0111_0g2833 [Alternaria gaisen]
MEKKYQDRDDEAKAFKEGYDQISNDIQMLQTERAVLQADYNTLKEEQEGWSKQQTSSSELHRVDQPAVLNQPISARPAVVRQTAELQHLAGLIITWQATLHNVTVKRNGSTERKEFLEGKNPRSRTATKEVEACSSIEASSWFGHPKHTKEPTHAEASRYEWYGGRSGGIAVSRQHSCNTPKASCCSGSFSCTERFSSKDYYIEHQEEPPSGRNT